MKGKGVVILICFFLAFFIGISVAADPFIPYVYPLYKQCDPRWGNDLMGGNDTSYDTICIQGCAMTSLSMALAGKGFTLNGAPVNPSSLNQWLQQNNGYTCIDGNCNNLVLAAPDKLDPTAIHFLSEQEKPSATIMQDWVHIQDPIAIAHVRDDTHFVLVVGFDLQQENTFYVNDPYYNNTSYMYDEITDVITYLIFSQNH